MMKGNLLKVVCDIIGKEFEDEVLILEITMDNYFISFDTYSMVIGKDDWEYKRPCGAIQTRFEDWELKK